MVPEIEVATATVGAIVGDPGANGAEEGFEEGDTE